MSHADDILDDMSFSDDDLLDSLADDMLMEMESESQQPATAVEEEHIPTIQPMRRAPTAPAAMGMPRGFPFGGGGGGAPAAGGQGMPDLSQMMSQMMPMMSKMMGGAAGAGAGAAGNRQSLQAPKLSWQELVRQHVPSHQQDEWLQTIQKDQDTQRAHITGGTYAFAPSRSYQGATAKRLPQSHLSTDTLLASLMDDAVRASGRAVQQNKLWKQQRDDLVARVNDSGLTDVFTSQLKQELRRRVARDPDYAAARAENPARFSQIAQALEV